MLAQRITKIAKWSVLTLLIAITADSLLAQDQHYVKPPSQRYEPVQAQTAPPSVHVQPAGAKRLTRSLSDESLAKWSSQPQGKIAQTSYQMPAAQELSLIHI